MYDPLGGRSASRAQEVGYVTQGIAQVLTYAVGVAVEGWLVLHNRAVMTVLFVVLGVDLVAKGLPPLGR